MSKEDRLRKASGKLSKDEKRYLNSKTRVVKRLVFGIVEYILIFLLMMVITAYMQNGSLENFEFDQEKFLKYLQPGGMIFNALVGYLPIIAISCIGVYFGEGTVGKMVFGIIKILAIIVWLVFVFQGATTSLQLGESISAMGLDDLSVGMEGLTKFAVLVLSCCLLIPIGEYAGARKKHKRALEHKENLQDI